MTNKFLFVHAQDNVSGEATILERPFAVNALAGDLDFSFGIDGTVQIDLGNKLNESAQAVAVQSDGKIITAGYAETINNGKDFAVVRINSDGTPDTSFNGGGKIVFNFNSASRDDVAKAVAVQPDGKIVVAGYADVLGFGNFDFVLARLNADGSLDSSFGTGGKIVTNLNDRADYADALALQSDGKIVAAGYSNRATTGDDFVAVRYNSNGALDASFGTGGIVITDVLTNRADRANGLALQPDGKVIAAGYSNDPNFKNNFALIRYNANGSLDTSFNGSGKVTTDLNANSEDYGNAVTLQSDGRILVAGESSSDFGLVRYNSNGSLDAAFGGGDGIVTTNFGSGAFDAARGVVAQADGKIIVAGKSRTELALARYNTDGSSDSSFSGDGLLIQNAGNNQLSANGGYFGIALQNDGKIVAAGDGWRDFSLNDFAVSRINANGAFDFTFNGGDGIVSTDINNRFDEATGIAVQSDGKSVVGGRTQNSTGGYDFAIARYNVNGTLDLSFDGDGIAVTDVQGHSDEGGYAVAVQPDGKIILGGQTNNASDGLLSDGVLIRYNSNGTLDSTFGTGGISVLPNPAAQRIRLRDLKIEPDGKIVVAGQEKQISIYGDGFVARSDSNGVWEKFLINGTLKQYATVDFNDADYIDAVALQSDGKIVIAGYTNEGPAGNFALARLNTDLTLDTSFDGDGKLTTDFGSNTFDAANDVEIQPDGKIVAAGRTDINFIDMAVARYNPNGSLDTTFGGGDGKLNIDFYGWGEICSAIALQPDGKIILGGVGDLSRNFSGFAVVKLTASGDLDTTFGSSGKVITNLGEGVSTGLGQGVNDMVLQADGKIMLAGTSNFNSTDHDFTLVRYENNSSMKTRFDYDGDGKSDESVFRPSNGVWYLNRSRDGYAGYQFGISSDKLAPADYDGDGKTDVAVYRDGNWFVLKSNGLTFASYNFGNSSDTPQPADYDGDGRAELAVYRSSDSTFYQLNTTSSAFTATGFGQAGDVPVVGDYDGDGKSDVAVYRPSNGVWYLNRSRDGYTGYQFGNAMDKLVPADYDGDGKTDVAVYRAAEGNWFILNSNGLRFSAQNFGLATDTPAPADYDGDGKTDYAVYRNESNGNGNWYELRTSSGFTAILFGASNDRPTPNAYVR